MVAAVFAMRCIHFPSASRPVGWLVGSSVDRCQIGVKLCCDFQHHIRMHVLVNFELRLRTCYAHMVTNVPSSSSYSIRSFSISVAIFWSCDLAYVCYVCYVCRCTCWQYFRIFVFFAVLLLSNFVSVFLRVLLIW